MATRALIGTIETDAAGNQVLTSTYNHYDGYPDSLGVALNNHYDNAAAAVKISNQGYISFLDPENGSIDAKHKEAADKNILPDQYEDAMRKVASIADSYGADYVYLYDFDDAEWLNSVAYGPKKIMDSFSGTGVEDQFEGYEGGDLADEDSIRNMEEGYESINEAGYEAKWAQFLNEAEGVDFNVVKTYIAKDKNIDGDDFALDAYIDSLKNSFRLNKNDYIDYEMEDYVEDFDNYVADKMDS